MKTLNDFLENAKTKAIKDFLNTVPNMTIRDFIKIHDEDFSDQKIRGITTPARIYIAIIDHEASKVLTRIMTRAREDFLKEIEENSALLDKKIVDIVPFEYGTVSYSNDFLGMPEYRNFNFNIMI